MEFLGKTIAPLGLGCWPIGGEMNVGDQSMGYANSDDAESLRAIHAALDGGMRLFDTAAAYGAGHSERLLAKALKDRPDALVVTKIGIGLDEDTKQLSFDPFSAADVAPAIDGCLRRLERERIDLLLLHSNEMPIAEAEGIFDAMEAACTAGKVGAYGWSTDFSESASAMATRAHFVAIEHSMNVFFDAPRLQNVVKKSGLTALIRSPLAMGLLSGKYDGTRGVDANDIRSAQQSWMEYFKDGHANPEYLKSLDAVRELLTTGGRSLVQGALGWIWAKGAWNLPIPGARTVSQVQGLTGALEFGALPQAVMEEIEKLIPRDPEAPDRPR